jgi:hypothetical protein
VTKPQKSLKAIRTKVAAPPVSRIAAVPSAYESETTRKRRPVASRTAGVSPRARSVMMPSAK